MVEAPYLTIAGYRLDSQMQSLVVDNQHIRLRSKLWQVLVYLAENQSKLVSRQMLIDNCWHGNSYTGEQGVTHTICHLRRIFKKNSIDVKIVTIPKRGYVLENNSILQANDRLIQSARISFPIDLENNIKEHNNNITFIQS
jgi:DNA-binding winged helix-turn-helix (wHTH) protein